MIVMVTGGSGFIGSALVRRLVGERGWSVINLDAQTYAGEPANVGAAATSPLYRFERADIRDGEALDRILAKYRPQAVVNLAAETHVDRSIDAPGAFIDTNVRGCGCLLESVTRYWTGLESARREAFRFLQVSTDEVFGDLAAEAPPWREDAPYAPSSPYAASKAGADHLTRAWKRTYGLPTLITHGSNTYGPRQFPEKLIPHIVQNALRARPIPIYGRGDQRRDWLFVDDHAAGLEAVLSAGRPGESYNLGGGAEHANLDVARRVCALLDTLAGPPPGGLETYAALIAFVDDRPGHDARYALDTSKIQAELSWRPSVGLEEGLRQTVAWSLAHPDGLTPRRTA